jgi:hypothetical protein
MATNKDFSEFVRNVVAFGQAHEVITAGSNRTFTASEYPRAVRANASGNIVMLDRDGTSATYAVLQGEVLIFSPSRVMSTSTVDVQVWW